MVSLHLEAPCAGTLVQGASFHFPALALALALTLTLTLALTLTLTLALALALALTLTLTLTTPTPRRRPTSGYAPPVDLRSERTAQELQRRNRIFPADCPRFEITANAGSLLQGIAGIAGIAGLPLV